MSVPTLKEMNWFNRAIFVILCLGLFGTIVFLGPSGWEVAMAFREPPPIASPDAGQAGHKSMRQSVSSDPCTMLAHWDPQVLQYMRDLARHYANHEPPPRDLLYDLLEANANSYVAASVCKTSTPTQIGAAVQGIYQAAHAIAELEGIQMEVAPTECPPPSIPPTIPL